MANQPASHPTSVFKNPQIILALISGTVTLVAAIIGVLPNLIPKTATVTPTMTPIIVTATALPSSIPVVDINPLVPTQVPVPAQPTLILLIQPTSNALPTPLAPLDGIPNVKLLYDNVAFNVLNHSDRPLSLAGVTFRSSSGTWDARQWGLSIYTSLPVANCLRLRDASSGQRTPPAACVNHIYGLIEAGSSALFWVNTDHFDVVRDDQVIATCATATGECDVIIPLT